MRSRSAAFLAAAIATSVLALDTVGRIVVPSRPEWLESLHPLLGAAPPFSFAFDGGSDPFADFRGRAFARRRSGKPRVLLVGGRAAARLLPDVERAVGESEVVLAAMDGWSTAQEAAVLARFAPSLDPLLVIAVDGDELAHPARDAGWTPEWDWERAAVESPVGEVLARASGLARLVFVPRRAPIAPAEARARYLEGARAVTVLAAARRLPLFHGFEPDASLDGRERESLRADLERIEPRPEAFGAAAEVIARCAERAR